MRIALVHNEVGADDAPDERDVLVQAETVTSALTALDHEVTSLGCTLDLADMDRKLSDLGPQLIFNLVESLGGYGSLIHLFPALLEARQLPYTGSDAETIRLTSNKIAAKRRMRHAGLPTPDWIDSQANLRVVNPKKSENRKSWIIKSLWEHASVGLDENSIIETDSVSELQMEMAKRSPVLGGSCFAEEFIPGREFNLSLLAGKEGPHVLPPAEISFEGFNPAKPRIVDYRAKWEEDSFEYQNTPRQFDFSSRDASLIGELEKLARRCWHVFGLRGYARVDFRVDSENKPWILEINANPCLSPDAGFAAALARAKIGFSEAVKAIIADAHSSSWN
jgi:D-alanine-D-alanine ligase